VPSQQLVRRDDGGDPIQNFPPPSISPWLLIDAAGRHWIALVALPVAPATPGFLREGNQFSAAGVGSSISR